MQMAKEKDQNEENPQASANESREVLDSLGVPSKVSTRHLNFYYGELQALFDNNLEIAGNRVTAIIGPSGCGKSTHIRVYNRIYSMYRDQRAEGEVLLDGDNILDPAFDIMELRRKVGMIFQKPTPFPMSVFDNVAYGLKLHYDLPRSEMKDRVDKKERRRLQQIAQPPAGRQSLYRLGVDWGRSGVTHRVATFRGSHSLSSRAAIAISPVNTA